MRLSIATKLGLGFIPALFALITVGALYRERITEIDESARWVTHTLEVQQQLENTRALLAETESSARAFMLSPQDSYRQATKNLASEARNAVKAIKRLTRDNTAQQERVDALGTALAVRLDNIMPRLEQKLPYANLDDLLDEGQRQGDAARALIKEMETYERQLLTTRQEAQAATLRQTGQAVLIATAAATILVIFFGMATVRSITQPLLRLESGAKRVGEGDYAHRIIATAHDEIGRVAGVFNQMVERIEHRERTAAEQNWIKSSLASFTPIFQAGKDLESVCQATLSQLATLLAAPCLVLYMREERHGRPGLTRRAHFAAHQASQHLDAGEGLAGQCLIEGRTLLLSDLPEDYFKVDSALGSTRPRHVFVGPIAFEAEVRAVIEIALMQPLSDIQREFLDRLSEGLGLMLNALEAKQGTEAALQAQTALTLTLQKQQDALKLSNEELALQSEQLRASERLAREQQEELMMANEEQHQANAELRQLTLSLDQKAQQLTETSAFKSEFLANMSHELRTPLNSLLILSKLLAEDVEHPLSSKQMQYAKTIHGAGNDLLALINEILDLAKIESGNTHIDITEVPCANLVQLASDTFTHVAQTRKVDFVIEVDPALSDTLHTDQGRVWQILKNLLSNAFKFTAQGRVVLRFGMAAAADGLPARLSMSVQDTGIGIPLEKQARIFEAFKQGDSGIARQYGGTGLGLSISQKLAHLLGGSLEVTSEAGQGSTFTLYLPADAALSAPSGAPVAALSHPDPAGTVMAPIAPSLPANHSTLMVVSDNEALVRSLSDMLKDYPIELVRLPEFAQVMAACEAHPPLLVVLDGTVNRGEMWMAMGHLKQDHQTRHVSIHVICDEDQRERSLRLGATSYTLLPTESIETLTATLRSRLARLTQWQRNVLVVEDDPAQLAAVLDLIGNGDIHAKGVATAAEALEAIAATPVDCVVIDLGLPDMDGGALIDELNQRLGRASPPVIVYTGRSMPRAEELSLMKKAQALIIKGVGSPERLIDELSLLMSRQPSRLSPSARQLIDRSRSEDPVLAGQNILVVDDDVRNIFAISAALETYGAHVIHAESGLAGIDMLHEHPDTHVVLMDVMMPTIDGLETIRRIRKLPQFAMLPIIAVTAKAMPGDRAACLEAGASDYLAKPVDMDRLRAMLRVWLTE
ncbi:MAG: response regulator [Aquabacterium sp.]|uniref:response regulator n=1 Tax=Aquabacterium sp. TaxID=1872578 RepID=UPI00271EAFB1|nr:response regulator [Aquabacterium sp.]MDO9003159.1 response regulator [Aquabacterium sp.]